MGEATTPLLQIKGISKSYRRGRETTTAVHETSLTIHKGEFLAIVGPSGSGKTTLTHMIGGLITPDTGSISVDGVELKKQSDKALSQYRNQKVGFVFQNASLIPYYTTIENVAVPLLVAHMPTRKRTEKAKHYLKLVGLEARYKQRADELSGGERQRVGIARALVNSPDIIIADEPTGSLDSVKGDEIIKILEVLHKQYGVTIIIVTHDLSIARRAQRIIHIRDGRIEKEATHASR
jgi:putative ABC transport system ATP-binding protein